MSHTNTAPAERRGIPHATFLVSRVVLAGRGYGDDTEDREEPVYENRTMGLWETVEELMTCDEPSCGRHVDSLMGSEHAMTATRQVGGWDETEIVLVRRGDGSPISGRMLLWLYRAAGLVWGPKRETVAVISETEDRGSRDLAWESLVDAAATAKLAKDHSLYLALEHLIECRENGTLGSLVREMELARAGATGDHPAVAENIDRRIAVAISA